VGRWHFASDPRWRSRSCERAHWLGDRDHHNHRYRSADLPRTPLVAHRSLGDDAKPRSLRPGQRGKFILGDLFFP